jgi:hypothetical protein
MLTSTDTVRRCDPPKALLSSLFVGAAKHPLTQADERILMPARHGIGQPAQLNGKLVQMLALRCDGHERRPRPHIDRKALKEVGIPLNSTAIAAIIPVGNRFMRGTRLPARPRDTKPRLTAGLRY